MWELLFTPTSISFLTQFLLLGSCCLFLFYMGYRHGFREPRNSLLGYFVAATLYMGCEVGRSSFYQAGNLYFVYFLPLAGSFCLLFAIRYAYFFPEQNPRWSQEFRLSMVYVGVLIIVEFGTLASRLEQLVLDSQPIWRGIHMDNFWVLGYAWVVSVLFRQAARAEKFESSAKSVWLALILPKSSSGLAARNTGLAFTFLIYLSSLDTSWNGSPIDWTQRIAPVISLWVIFMILIWHNDHQKELVPFRVKLALFCMTLALCLFNVTGWMTGKVDIRQFNHHALGSERKLTSWLQSYQTFKWEKQSYPNALKEDVAYKVSKFPFRLEYEWGSKVDSFDGHDSSKTLLRWQSDQPLKLPFRFKFFDRFYDEIFVSEMGFISFERQVQDKDLRYQYGSTPMIVPLFEPVSYRGGNPRSGLYIESSSELFRVTWCELHNQGDPGQETTFQLTLFRSGDFEITYTNVSLRDWYGVSSNPWPYSLVAVLPGLDSFGGFHPPAMTRLGLNDEARPITVSGAGIVQDHYLEARRHLHPLLLWKICTMLILVVLLILGIPFMMRFILEIPLNNLAYAVQEVDQGNLKAQARVYYRDELGEGARSFNQLVDSARQSSEKLQLGRANLENEVDNRTETLLQEVRHRELVAVELEDAERALSSLMASLPGVVFRMKDNWDGAVEFISYRAQSIFETEIDPALYNEMVQDEGRSGAKLKFPSLRSWIHEDDLMQAKKVWERALVKRKAYQIKYRIRVGDNRIKWIREHGQFSEESGEWYCEGLLLDMSESKKVEQQLERAKLQAEKASKSKSAFVANMSHEIRTPLNSILGYAQLLCQAESLSPIQKSMMLKIKNNGSALLTFINDILDLAKIEAGRMDWVRREFDLISLLESIAEKYSVRCAAEGVSWRFDIGESKDSLWVVGDEKKLLQTLSHLLNLSIQRSNGGSICLKVARQLDDTWTFTIEDSGTAPKFNEGLIVGDSFEITEDTSDRNMALSIGVCKRLTQLMKGSFSMNAISSEGGVKTSIALPLPCVKESLFYWKSEMDAYGDAFDPNGSNTGQGRREESHSSPGEVGKMSKLKLCEQMREAVYSGAATWMDNLISELEKFGSKECEIASNMRQALKSYKMDLLEKLVDQIELDDEGGDSGE